MATAKAKTTYTAAEVAALESTIQTQQNQIQEQQAQIEELKRKLDHMNECLANAQRARFGQSSEKASYVMAEDQLSLFNEAEKEQDHEAEEPTEETLTVKAHARKKKKTIDEMAKGLPVKQIIPQQCRIIEYYSCTYACDRCEKDTGFAHIVATQTPPVLMKHSLASPSTVARCYDPEICGVSAPGPAGKDLGQRGRAAEPYHHGQLDDPVQQDLAETAV